MNYAKKTPSAGDAEGSENVLLGGWNECKDMLSRRRIQYLNEVFALSPDTAATIAVLAFGEVRS